MVASDYPFLDVVWTMLIFFGWVIWFWLLITVFSDLFRRHDLGESLEKTGEDVRLPAVTFAILPQLTAASAGRVPNPYR